MNGRTKTAFVVVSLGLTTLIVVVGTNGFAAMMHWLDRHPAGVTALHLSSMLSLPVLAFVNYYRRRNQLTNI